MINVGDLLRAFGFVTRDQLAEALEEQKRNPGRRLGEILVTMKAASRSQVEEVLGKQDRLRSKATVGPKDAAAIADYATHVVIEHAGEGIGSITGIYDVTEMKASKPAGRRRWPFRA